MKHQSVVCIAFASAFIILSVNCKKQSSVQTFVILPSSHVLEKYCSFKRNTKY